MDDFGLMGKNTNPEVETTTLNLRKVPVKVAEALRVRAASNNRSVEAELREIVSQSLGITKRVSFTEALSMIPDVGKDSDFERVDDNGHR